MKKIVFVLLFISSVTIVNAQDAPTPKAEKTNGVHLGIRAGLNLANIIRSDNNAASTQLKPGLNAAAFLEIPIVNGFSIQPEVQYSEKGYKTSGSYLGNPYEYTASSNFIEVPILAKISPAKGFGILVGPQYSFLTNTKYKFTSNTATYQNQVNNDNSNLRNNILGGVLGLEFSGESVVLDLRYSLDFQKNNEDGTSNSLKYKNQVLGISIGFRF
jgi:Outer membrane protein beta-barrel domain